MIHPSWLQFGVTPSTREPACDIAAQISALLDPAHPKDAVFIAAGNEGEIPGDLDQSLMVVARPIGIFLTTNSVKADLFQTKRSLADADLAHLLGFPETKAKAVESGAPIAFQARDRIGSVVAEAITSPAMAGETQSAIGAQVPAGGSLVSLSVLALQIRRAVLLGEIDDPFRSLRVLHDNMVRANKG